MARSTALSCQISRLAVDPCGSFVVLAGVILAQAPAACRGEALSLQGGAVALLDTSKKPLTFCVCDVSSP